MKRILILAVVAGLGAGGYFYYTRGDAQADTANGSAGAGGRGGRGAPRGGDQGFGGGGFGGPGGFGGGRGPGGPRPSQMTVEFGAVKRADMSEQVTVVGNLIGAQTVDAVARVAGRLDTISVRLGDQVVRGQQVAKVEDREIVEQIKQAQAAYDVSAATIRQRDADLRQAQTGFDRNKSLHERQLISKQQFDDAEARLQAATAQLDLSKAQFAQAQARLDELKLSLGNTIITSPVNGFVSKRVLDQGAWVTNNTSFMSFVDISTVRLVANVIEKDLRRVTRGLAAETAVDAYPGETFKGRIARLSPVLDPATRTAQIEVEINNQGFRLKPGMYAKVTFTVENRPQALVVPTNSLVDLGGKRGVFRGEGNVAKFQPLQVGLTNASLTEVTSGIAENEKIVTTGAGALREGDKLVVPGQAPATADGPSGGGGGGGRSADGGGRSGGGRSGGGGGRSGGGGGRSGGGSGRSGGGEGRRGGGGGNGQRGSAGQF